MTTVAVSKKPWLKIKELKASSIDWGELFLAINEQGQLEVVLDNKAHTKDRMMELLTSIAQSIVVAQKEIIHEKA